MCNIYFVTVVKISGKNGAANVASRCINVPKQITIIPISSSLYSSSIAPHSEQRLQTASSPIRFELYFDISKLNKIILKCISLLFYIHNLNYLFMF